ncbi:hypothetical protein LMH73_015260 [Vibrio splendidus]|nr:hypothetical protein [Vibrio splendidus]MCC4882877.1 hypothetical protein [Vibrio splendidus]
MKHCEHILAVNSSAFTTTGMVESDISIADVVVAQRKGLEIDPSFRQLITYAVLKHGNKLAVYRRTPKGGENRLHGATSVGFGGHIDAVDMSYDENGLLDIAAVIDTACKREIQEELDLTRVNVLSEVQLSHKIVLDGNDVDKVHVGIVFAIEVDSEDVSPAEEQLDWVGFKTYEEILGDASSEAWTIELVKHLQSL